MPRGRFVKVVAIDPVSLIEVAIVGDSQESDTRLKQIALKKLEYVLRKRGDPRVAGGSGGSANQSQSSRRRGIVV